MDPARELIKNAQTGDERALERLLGDNQGLIWSIVRRYCARGYDAQDLFQIGSIGLLKAIRRFDFSYDTRLSTYAIPMIQGEIRRFLRDDGMLKISRAVRGQAVTIRRSVDVLFEKLGRDPTLSELAEATGFSEESIMAASCSLMPVESLERPLAQEEGQEMTLSSRLADPRGDPDQDMTDHFLLEELLSGLREDERDLIRRRYIAEQTQSQIAEQLGMSQVQVCRKEKRILHKLREMAEEAGEEE